MKPFRRAAPVLLVLVALTACSSTIEGSPRPAADDVPVTEEGDTLSLPGDDEDRFDPALERLLIGLDDLPPGWTVDEAEDSDDDGSDGFDQCIDGVEPPAFLGQARGGVAGEAEVDFSGPDGLSSISQTLIRMDFAEDTEVYLLALAEVFGQCSEQTVDIDGRPATVRIVPAPLPGVGDLARSWVMTLDVGIAIDLHFAAIAQDEFVTIIFNADPLGDGRTALVDLARTAVAKLS